MQIILIQIIGFVAQVLTIVVLIDVVISYFMSPFSPIRMVLDRVVGPMLAPIRRVVPTIGMVDISPIILLILIQVVASILDWIVGRTIR